MEHGYPATALPYPQRSPFTIKSINTDHWPDNNELLRANLEGVVINLVWSNWEAQQRREHCLAGQQKYDGYCYQISPVFDREIRYWSGQGKNVTGVIWGVPQWARRDDCTGQPGREIFCSSSNIAAFARFTGMLAKRYGNASGNGLINDFVLHNEVNMNEWYNHSCGGGVACNAELWMDNYLANFNAAYDRITSENPTAKIFAPFAHQFHEVFDTPAASRPLLSVKTFIRHLNAGTGDRIWRIAYHPYNKSLFETGFTIDDLPHVTFGNIGVLAGWLRAEFPLQPESWEIYLTESGYNSLPPQGSEPAQAADLCQSLYNALATPGIENYIYHRLQDHPAETAAGIALGLRDHNGRAKPAWFVWANSNGRNGNRSNLACGFENLPFTRVSNYRHTNRNSRVSSRIVRSGYQQGQTWLLNRNHLPQATMLYECQLGSGSYLTRDMFCHGNRPLGPVGYSRLHKETNSEPLYSCELSFGRMVSNDETCGDGRALEFLGYARPAH
ncbi:hypothetical protein AB833_07285 [Chromatiales bacterium (ex Bugula neritina AB1)]|nr:hypothetical protein AB833_07285 [Chromatiales bacterium (ex Bugula neritina AB1)]